MAEDTLKNKIQADMVAAMRAQDKVRLGIIRMVQAAIKQQEIDERTEGDERLSLNDVQVLSILDKMIRQRRESIKQFEAANRDDLVQKEALEITVIQEFLPSPLTPEEIQALIQQTIKAIGATSIRDMAKVMAELKPKLQGRADIGEVGVLIKNQLAS
jgi:hypothetical protein